MNTKNISKIRAHDAIVGLLYLSGVGLSYLTGNFNFLWIIIGTGALQVISPLTKFCPVYFILNKMMPDSDPIQNGSQKLKAILKILIIIVSVTVITAWTYNINLDTTFRGGDATNMIEEFEAYGLNQTTMVVVGIFKVSCAIMLLFGLKYRKLILPSAGVMALFMIAAVYFHLSISDPIIPTAPSLLMLASCLSIIYLDRRI